MEIFRPEDKERLVKLGERIKALRAEIEKALAAGVDVSKQKARLDVFEARYRRFMEVYFPEEVG